MSCVKSEAAKGEVVGGEGGSLPEKGSSRTPCACPVRGFFRGSVRLRVSLPRQMLHCPR